MTEAQWDETLDVNLKSVFLCTQALACHVVARGGGGNIVNVASIEAVNPALGHSHYTASKAGMVMFTQTARAGVGGAQHSGQRRGARLDQRPAPAHGLAGWRATLV